MQTRSLKYFDCLLTLFLYLMLMYKYINGKLKVKVGLDTTLKPKLVVTNSVNVGYVR